MAATSSSCQCLQKIKLTARSALTVSDQRLSSGQSAALRGRDISCKAKLAEPCLLRSRSHCSKKNLLALSSTQQVLASSFGCLKGAWRLKSRHSRSGLQQRQCVAMAATTTKPRKVLFVCLGNICRSPTAEAVFRAAVEKRGLSNEFEIDSAGTIDYHQGGPADGRMTKHAARRGVKLTSISRPIVKSDFENFDLILAMDENNQRDIHKAFDKWNSQKPLPADARDRVKLMCDYCQKFDDKEVPDPYYGGAEGFEKVLDLLDDACEGLLNTLV